MKSIRVLITGDCNANCPNCINRTIRKQNTYISVSDFEDLCRYFSGNMVKNIRIMGGEPTTHPDFSRIIDIAQSYFERVTIFTNGINDLICQMSPRAKDGINYNFRFHSFWNEQKLLVEKLGTRIFEVVVTSSTDEVSLMKELSLLRKYPIEKIIVSLSLDCTENIFVNRTTLVRKLTYLNESCKVLNYEVIFDHTLPICFVYGTSIPIRTNGAFCNGDCAGLVDMEMNVRFCNQFSQRSFSIKENNQFIPYSVFVNYMQLYHMKNQVLALEKICVECPLYNRQCNGGCFLSMGKISRDDVIMNTNLPIC